MVVEIDGRYAYRWTDRTDPLKLGDVVWLPGSGYQPYGFEPWKGKVTGFGTTYTGYLSGVLGRVPAKAAGA